MAQSKTAKKSKKVDGDAAVREKIASMADPDRKVSERLHAIITANGPELAPRLWYGMPAYSKDDKVICFFRDTQKFKERYMTLGFNQSAQLDDGAMWPIAFALVKLTAADEKRIAALVKKAVS